MADVICTSYKMPNYSGMLFVKGNTKTPLSTMIGGRQKVTDHVEFVTGLEYDVGGGAQPNISENASLTAPDATAVTREQKTNVTQIFHESIGVSYGHMSNMGTLAGINVANQQANPLSELDFQAAARMKKIANDIEYTFINGVYKKATSDATANQSRGLVNAITTNEIAVGGKALTFDYVAEGVKSVYESNGDTAGLVLLCDPTTMLQINADAAKNKLTVVPSQRDVNGIALREVVTPLGTVYLYVGQYLPAGTALLLNIDVIAPVHQPVPGKGNFFLEQLAKVGAGEKYQIFGQIGLDHGPEWYHAKFTGIKTASAVAAG